MKRVGFLFPLVICLLLMLTPTVAQEDDGGTPDDLLNALLITPDTELSRAWFSYVDFRGMEYARPGAERPSSLVAFLDGSEENLPQGLWFNALLGIHNGPSDTFQYLMLMGNMSETIGMDFMEVEQGLQWGQIPESVSVFLGDFDSDAIATAYTSREYSSSELNGLTVWCNDEVGCEGGTEMDVQGRRPEVPFGGHLGQRRPMLELDEGIASSMQFELLEMIADVESGDVRSLGETPEYRTLVEALDDSLITIQALIIPPEVVEDSTIGIFRRLTPETRAALYERLFNGTTGDVLPAYELIGIVDQASDRQQRPKILLVYDDVSDARQAERLIPDRINEYESLATQRTFPELLEDRGAYYVTDIYTSEETGKSVLILDFRAPIANDGANDDTGRLDQSSMVSKLLTDMVIRQDLGWLATSLPTLEEIEAALDG